MKPIIVKDQVRLGPKRCLQLALSGMGYRMFRSMVTVSILALAVAFLVHVLAHGMLSHRITVRAWEGLADVRAVGTWGVRLTQPDDEPTIWKAVVRARDARLKEYQRFAQATDAQMQQARTDALAIQRFARWLEDLSDRDRVVLTGGRDALGTLHALAQPDNLAAFMKQITTQLSVPMPLGDQAAFQQLLTQQRPAFSAFAQRVARGQARAIEQIRKNLDHKPVTQLLADPPASMESVVRAAGFEVETGTFTRLAVIAKADADRDHLARLIQPREVRNLLATRLSVPVALVNQAEVLNWLTNESRAKWLAQVIKDKTGDTRLSPQRLRELAEHYHRTIQLQTALGDQQIDEIDDSALPTGTLWLIALSFLVCVVGVANAMLMSVTERFAEIATMKCLGAMDAFVMTMFLFEAMLQGFFGGIVGLVLGLLLAFLRAWAEFGNLTFGALDVIGSLLLGAGVSLVVGVLLAALAAVWPAYIASRLAPMEAMRVE